MADAPAVKVGDPVVVEGTKYRIRSIEGSCYSVAAAPKRTATHRLEGELTWDARVGVWRTNGFVMQSIVSSGGTQ